MAIPQLTTERLLLRPFVLEDAPTVQELVSPREVAAPLDAMPHPYPDGAAAEWIATHAGRAEAGSAFTWAVTTLRDGTLIGAIEIRAEALHQRGEFGYWTGMPYWNQGFTTEAAGRVVRQGFETLDLHRIQALVLPGNTGSVRVLEKLGFQREGVLRDYVLRWGEFQDRAIYGLVRDEWKHQSLS
jgi:[ribosomal protein S5]-alanine N-acetyltransferase